jgi:RHH-type rel operon transcriptional repressor/antitoxin RelB
LQAKRVDADTKKRLDALSKRSKRSKSFLAAEAIAIYVESEEWQLGELQAGIAELDSGQEVSHEKVSKWLKSWGNTSFTFVNTSHGTQAKMQLSWPAEF